MEDDEIISDELDTKISEVVNGLAKPPNFRSSSMQSLNRSPLDFLIQSFTKKDTSAMRFGRAFHSKLLTPVEFEESYWCYPQGVTGVSKAGKEFAQGKDKAYKLSQAEMILINKMCGSVMSSTEPDLKQYLEHPKTFKEFPLSWIEKDSGITCTGRPDMFYVFEDTKTVSLFDFKTTDKTSNTEFEEVIFEAWYHVQAAMYIDAVASNFGCQIEDIDSFIVAVQKSYPYSVMTFELLPETIAMGMAVYKRLASLYKKCSDTRCWPGEVEYNHYLTYPEAWGDPSEIQKVIKV